MNDSMNFALISSEIVLLSAACCIMVVDLFQRDRERKLTFSLSIITLIALMIIDLNRMPVTRMVGFDGHWVLDTLGVTLKLAIYLISAMTLLYARPFINHRNLMRGEYYLLTLFAVLGMMIMVSANSFLIVYLGLELLSLSLYALVALQRDAKPASEAAVKYFVMGGMASGFLLYGISLIYGSTGSIIITEVASFFNQNQAGLVSQFGLVFIVIGLAFKFGAVPFHMWLPDVYHGSPSSITAFIASAPKIAVFGMSIRLLVEAFGNLVSDWSHMIMIVGLLSVIFGNLVAVAQNNLKRLLSYSAIAHIGYFLLGLAPGTPESFSASMYYIIVYALMTVAGFGIVIFLSTSDKEYQNITDLQGLGRYHPWYGLMFSFVMVSMAGIPPFIGFWPKLEIFRNLVSNGFVVEAIVAIAFTVVGLFYYLRVIKEIFFTEATDGPEITSSRSLKISLTMNCLVLLILGLMPDSIYDYCLSAFGLLN